jgi:uncharacterized protein (TIGR03437 family)
VRFLVAPSLLFLNLSVVFGANVVCSSVGNYPPNPSVTQAFRQAYDRTSLALLVSGPIADVKTLGSPGLVQEFTPVGTACNSNNITIKYALVKPDPTAPPSGNDTLLMYPDVYAAYTNIGPSAAGYPTMDTAKCPSNSFGPCTYSFFTKNYAIFSYTAPNVDFSISDPIYTEWTTLGGTVAAGTPTSATSTVTSFSKISATLQSFTGASIFVYPAGSSTAVTHGVIEPFNTPYLAAGGYSALGLPTSEATLITSSGITRQTFEYGRIEMAAGGTPTVLFALSEVDITFASLGLNLNVGDSATINATTMDIRALQVTGRSLTWNSTNPAVARVTGNGYSATVQALGAGLTNIYATAEGKTSAPLAVRVGGGVCCAIGEGAPTQTISQAFQSAVTRNSLSVVLPAPSVVRQGSGYTQTLSLANNGGSVIVAIADGSGSAWVLSGAIYAAYLSNGGFSGPLGYPASDPLPAGGQQFASGAVLAGNPVRVIPVPIASKWRAGAAAIGLPASDAVAFTSFSGITGYSQVFSGGTIFGILNGTYAGQAFFSAGLILDRYLALSGTVGALGAPASDIFANGSVMVQNFETGYIDLQPGAASAVEHFNPRHPAVSISPATVVPGGRVHVAATGFAPGASLSFAITGQPAFSTTSAAGAYSWDIVIPATAKPATITIQAAARNSTDTASASYTIMPVAALLPALSLISGDRQSGAPRALLPAPLIAVLTDSQGNPIGGSPLSYTASPGAAIMGPAATDSQGRATVAFRMPSSPGVAVGSIAAGGKVVEFSALAAAALLPNFPAFTATDSNGTLTAALAAVMRYYQNSGQLSIANGSATPSALAQFLASHNGYAGNTANPWAAAQFAGASLVLESPSLDHTRDVVASGAPLILILKPQGGGSVAVTATGINADGTVAIADPSPAAPVATLDAWLASGAILTAALRISTPLAAPAPFVVSTLMSAGATLGSMAGGCTSLDLSDAAGSGGGIRFFYCDGAQSAYELDLAQAADAVLLDLGTLSTVSLPSGGTLSWRISRDTGKLAATAQALTITSVVDAASFGTNLAPGSLISIFGAAFPPSPSVMVEGRAATVLAAFPMQINAQIPPGIPPGTARISVLDASAAVTITPVAPAIFPGAVVNVADGAINSAVNPVQRGQFVSLYCAGLGATTLRNGFQVPNAPVTASVNGTSITPSFTGLLPGFIGLYQVNLPIPPATPPTLTGVVFLQQGPVQSNSAPISIQ